MKMAACIPDFNPLVCFAQDPKDPKDPKEEESRKKIGETRPEGARGVRDVLLGKPVRERPAGV